MKEKIRNITLVGAYIVVAVAMFYYKGSASAALDNCDIYDRVGNAINNFFGNSISYNIALNRGP